MATRSLILGTRGSALATWQARYVQQRLSDVGISSSLQTISTTGDERLDVPFAQIGAKGLFTRELDDALLRGEIDLAVHSLKDLPTLLPDGIEIAAIPERASPFDAFVAHPDFQGKINDLPRMARVGTSSIRRKSQLLAWRTDLRIEDLRGNVDTRLRKLDEGAWHGVVLAEAGLLRLGLADRIRQRVPREVMLPAAGQGALAVVCATSAAMLRADLRDALHHPESGSAVLAERSFLRRLEGGCSVPVGALAAIDADVLTLEGCIASAEGGSVIRRRSSGLIDDAEDIGLALADELLARGGAEILDAIREVRS